MLLLSLRVANDDTDIHICASEKKALESVVGVNPIVHLAALTTPAAEIRVKVKV
jgi:hypothetical protein